MSPQTVKHQGHGFGVGPAGIEPATHGFSVHSYCIIMKYQEF